MIKCPYCKWRGHFLPIHLQKRHGVTVMEFVQKHDDCALLSEEAAQQIRRATARPAVEYDKVLTPIGEVFEGVSGTLTCPACNGEKQETPCPVCNDDGIIEDTRLVPVNKTRHPLCPDEGRYNEHFVFQQRYVMKLLTAFFLPKRNRLWILGPTGCGKSDFIVQAHLRLKRGLVTLDANAYMKKSTLTGRPIAKDGSSEFVPGPIPVAMERGATLLINEVDTLNPDCMNTIKPVLEDPATIRIEEASEMAGESGFYEVKAHPDFRVIGTANTKGDGAGLDYVNTFQQSLADKRRFNLAFEMSYPDPDVEALILTKYFPAVRNSKGRLIGGLIKEEAQVFVKVANHVRARGTEATLSTGQLICWAEHFLLTGDVRDAAHTTFLTLWPNDLQIAVMELINAEIGVPSK